MLLYGSAAVLVVVLGLALWYRQPAAVALAGFALVIPGSWLLGLSLLHSFQGIIYPLTLAGAAALAVPMAAARWGRARVAILAALMVATIGLRVPQFRATTDRYVHSVQPYRTIARQSDTTAIRNIVGNEPVDMALGHAADNHMAIAELGVRGVPLQFRPPAWERSLKNWARLVKCPEPDLYLPKARFTLLEKNAYAPPETVRWVGSRLKLIEDRDAVTVLGVAGTQEMIWDAEWRPGVWIGNTPTTLLIHNGTGRPQCVRLIATTSAGPAHPNRDVRTLGYRLNNHTGTLSLPNENTAAIPLHLTPGLNRVELFVVERASPEPAPKAAVPLLAFCNWRIEVADALPRTDQR